MGLKMRFFEAAKQATEGATYTGNNAKIGGVAVYKGHIIAKGANSDKTTPTMDAVNRFRYKNSSGRYLPPKSHCEDQIWRKIRWLDIDFSQVEIYLYRELKNGTLAMSRPCRSCIELLKAAGISKIYYTTNDGYVFEKFK